MCQACSSSSSSSSWARATHLEGEGEDFRQFDVHAPLLTNTQDVIKVAVRHKLFDEQPWLLLQTHALQPHNVVVLELRQDLCLANKVNHAEFGGALAKGFDGSDLRGVEAWDAVFDLKHDAKLPRTYWPDHLDLVAVQLEL